MFKYFKHLLGELNRMSTATENLTAAVQAQTAVITQVVDLISQLKTSSDPAVQAAADAILANTAQLNTAITG
jgi:hypothetical protein